MSKIKSEIEPIYVRPEEAAELLGVSRSSLYRQLRDGLIPSVTIGRCRRIPVQALRELQHAARGEA